MIRDLTLGNITLHITQQSSLHICTWQKIMNTGVFSEWQSFIRAHFPPNTLSEGPLSLWAPHLMGPSATALPALSIFTPLGHRVSFHNSDSLLSTGQIVIFRWMRMTRRRVWAAYWQRKKVWRQIRRTARPLSVNAVPNARHKERVTTAR